MFNDLDLLEHVNVKNTLKIESLIIAEWNLNDLDVIENYGNYRNTFSAAVNSFIPPIDIYDPSDEGDYYSDGLKSEKFSIFGAGEKDADLFYTTPEKDREIYYSLKDCFDQFRPRSGINKPLWFKTKYIDNIRSNDRPRYYVASKQDNFKYWNSYRKENRFEKGISLLSEIQEGLGYPVEDVAPFVIYNKEIPVNRIVIKMQTNLANLSGNDIVARDGSIILDPLSDINSSSIPKKWKVQYLDESDTWVNAISFDENSLRRSGLNIVGSDGHVEMYYGIKVPENFKNSFYFSQYLSSSVQLPEFGIRGETYVVRQGQERGVAYTWDAENTDWIQYVPEYGFSLFEDGDIQRIGVVKQIYDPDYFIEDNKNIFTEFLMIKGIRIVVDTMYAPDTPFELIEISPRLKTDISEYVLDFDITKSISMSNTTLPVGGLSVSNGSIRLMNYDGIFDQNNIFNKDTNEGSLIAQLLKPNIRFDIYEAILDVKGYDKYIPIKTFYSEDFPTGIGGIFDLNLSLRDLFFRFETITAPTMFLKNITLTAAVAILLDNIGFSNYVFKNLNRTTDPVIPYYFIEPDISVAEVLNRLAIATQTAMFFDEYNNFVVMSKEYLLPEPYERFEDFKLLGQKEVIDGKNYLPNIIDISNADEKILNDGQINYTIRYVQKEVASLAEYGYVEQDRTYRYKPVLLWEVGSQELEKTINEKAKQGGYALGAVALKNDLTKDVPIVESNKIKNNTISLGEDVYWLPRFQGYLYANGEIIRYDAVEYQIASPALQNLISTRYITRNIQIITPPNNFTTYESLIIDSQNNSSIESLKGNSKDVWENGKQLAANLNANLQLNQNADNRVWISNNQEYQKYFSSIPFNGKLYPTGNVRIYCEPFYEELQLSSNSSLEPGVVYKNGPVKTHGRGQFNTSVVYHYAGLSKYWSESNIVRGINMQSQYLFSTRPIDESSIPYLKNGEIALNFDFLNLRKSWNDIANKSKRTGIISNFMRKILPVEISDAAFKLSQPGTIQSSAFIFSGADSSSTINKRDFISYAYKELDPGFKHFGTRMRIIGKVENNGQKQSPSESFQYYSVTPTLPGESPVISGGSGGLGIFVDPETGFGYYFEIISLTADNLSQYTTADATTNQTESVLHNIVFYKVVPGGSQTVAGYTSPGIYLDLTSFKSSETVPVLISVTQDSAIFHFINIPGVGNIPENYGAKIVNLQGGRLYGPCSAPNGRLFIGNENVGIRNSGSKPNSTLVVEEGGDDWDDMVLSVNKGYFRRISSAPTIVSTEKAIPIKLWGGVGNILVDEGKFVGMDRVTSQANPTVYDLAVEFEQVGSVRRFFLYINNNLVATVDDNSSGVISQNTQASANNFPKLKNNMALFTRGTSKCMFENIYALKNLQSQNSGATLVKNTRDDSGNISVENISGVFGDDNIVSSEALKKYAISGLIQSSYLSGISAESSPKFDIYYEEFGTIMRECAYFNIKYDKAYPAFIAKLAPTFNNEKTYATSGFFASSYGAEFLIFNSTDKAIVLEESSGNYLRILGITFTQNTSQVLTVDDYFRERSNFSDPVVSNNILVSPERSLRVYENIRNSRSKYGKKSFSLESPYIQDEDTAKNIMDWIINKTMRKRMLVDLEVFGASHLQLGDIVSINYKFPKGYSFVDEFKKFVIHEISYRRTPEGISNVLKVVEV
jgi:hypothetical protein